MHKSWFALSLLLAACTAESTTPAASGPPCSFHSDCAAAQVCVAKTCAPAFPRSYRLTIDDAGDKGLNSFDENGTTWDDGSEPASAPDVYAVVKIAGTQACRTPTAKDTLAPKWSHACTLDLKADSLVTFEVWDDDADVAKRKGQPTLVLTRDKSAQELLDELRAGGKGMAQQISAVFYTLAVP